MAREGKKNSQYRHGMSDTSIHNRWRGMLARCHNPKCKQFYRYGGRGIYVAEEWQQFEPFYAWAVESGYRQELELDRIDNDGPYSPENCRWVTPAQNARNRRDNRVYRFGGEEMCITDAARKYGIPAATITERIDKGGMSPDEAVAVRKLPLGKKGVSGEFLIYFGERLNYAQAEERFGIKWCTIRYRIKAGLTPEEAVSRPLRSTGS